MFLGINMFLALLRPHFNPRYARAKMSQSRAKNIFMPANINSIVIFTDETNSVQMEQYARVCFHKDGTQPKRKGRPKHPLKV